MEDTELAGKRQVTLEKTEVSPRHKSGGISTLASPSHPLHQAARCQEQDQFIAGLPNLLHTKAHTENADADVGHRGKQTGPLARGLPSSPAAPCGRFQYPGTPVTHSCAQNTCEKSHVTDKEPMCFPVHKSNHF